VFVSDSIWSQDGSVSIVTRPRAGRFRFRILAEVKYFSPHTSREGLWSIYPSIQWVPVFYPGYKSDWSLNLTTQLDLAPRLTMSGAIPLCAFMACTGTTLTLPCLFTS